jgi:hypothetical protein
MTNDDMRRVQQRIADARLARRREDDAIAAAPTRGAVEGTERFRVGDRVLDLRSGREGDVTDVGPADRTGAILVGVRFSDGSRGLRDVADLMARPTPPAARQ